MNIYEQTFGVDEANEFGVQVTQVFTPGKGWEPVSPAVWVTNTFIYSLHMGGATQVRLVCGKYIQSKRISELVPLAPTVLKSITVMP